MNLKMDLTLVIYLYLSTALILLYYVVFALHVKFMDQYPKLSSAFIFLGQMAMPLKHIGFITIYQVCYYFLICIPNSPYHTSCEYNAFKIFNMGISAICLVLSFVLAAIFAIYLYEPNPFENKPYSKPNRIDIIPDLILKPLLPLVFVIFPENNQPIIEICLLFFVIEEFQMLFNPPSHKLDIVQFIQYISTLKLWTCISSTILHLLDNGKTDSYSSIYTLIGAPIFYILVRGMHSRRTRALLSTNIELVKSKQVLQSYINQFSRMLLFLNQEEFTPLRIAFLYFHRNNCPNWQDPEFCVCSELRADNHEVSLEDWIVFYNDVLRRVNQIHPNLSSPFFKLAYLNFSIENNIWKSLSLVVLLADSNKTNFQQNYELERLRIKIESEMNSRESENDQMLVNVMEFQEKFKRLRNEILNCAQSKQQLLKELQVERPSYSMMNKLSQDIVTRFKTIETSYNKLGSVSEDNTIVLSLYGQYLLDVKNETRLAVQIFDRLSYTTRDTKRKLNYQQGGSQSNLAILVLSGNKKDLGTMISANDQALKLFNYSRTEIEGEKVNKLMPQFISKHHDNFLTTFMKTGTSAQFGEGFLVLGLDSHGYLLRLRLVINILPDISKGIQLVGFLYSDKLDRHISEKNKDRVKYLWVVEENSGQIECICENTWMNLGLYPQGYSNLHVRKSNYNISYICKELATFHNIEKKFKGIEVELDTTVLLPDGKYNISEENSSSLASNSKFDGKIKFLIF